MLQKRTKTKHVYALYLLAEIAFPLFLPGQWEQLIECFRVFKANGCITWRGL